MQVKLSDHAHKRRRQRHITVAEIEAVLDDPEIDRPSKAAGRRLYEAHPNGHHVAVVVREGTKPLIVVTVWSNDEV